MQKEIQSIIITAMKQYDLKLWTHCKNTATLIKMISVILELREPEKILLYNAALIHDVGKIFINPNILLKPQKLTPDERKIVDLHSVLGQIYVSSLGVKDNIAELILLHHGYDKERYGKTYSTQNCFYADILRACDILEAVTHDRPYHNRVSIEEGIKIVQEQKDLNDSVIDALNKVFLHDGNGYLECCP